MTIGKRFFASDNAAGIHPDVLAAIVEANQADQRAAGHWGVPMTVFNNEPFFGQDRFDQLKWRLEQQGLRRRS